MLSLCRISCTAIPYLIGNTILSVLMYQRFMSPSEMTVFL
jgi:hypothetical protein